MNYCLNKFLLQINIPDWIVNLRHTATHFTMPSVELLDKAVDYLFQWLKDRYVNTYNEIAVERSVLENVKVYIHDLFVDYIKLKFKVFT
jgi:hypothetical protein